MALPKALQDREYEKFDLNSDGEVIVRTSLTGDITGEFTPTGLKNGGRVTEVTLSDSSWTALPPGGALLNRNAINIQNYSGSQIKINYSVVSGYVGAIINDNSERNYDITEHIQLYARAEIGAPLVIIEEIS
jgi:hypothetical protein